MAVHAGLGATKVLVIFGAGVVGTVVLGKRRVSDILEDFSKVLSKHLKEDGDKSGDGNDAALVAQVRRLSQELRQLAASNRPITVVNGSPSSSISSLTSLIVPVAVLGAAGYGYLWWKGGSWGDIMYVTQKTMSTAVGSVSKQLENVSSAVSHAKRQLTQKLDFLTKRLDDNVAIQGLIKDQVYEVQGEVQRSRVEIENVQRLVEGLEVKIDEVQGKQDFANQGILYLCQFLQSIEMPQQPELLPGSQSRLLRGSHLERSTSSPAACPIAGLKDLQYISDSLDSRIPHETSGTPETPSMNSTGDIRLGRGLGGTGTPNAGLHRHFSIGSRFRAFANT